MAKDIDVVGAVLLREGRVFAARRGDGKPMAGMWEFPGGKIEQGEIPEEALARELREELKINAHVGDRLTLTRHEYDFGVVNLATYFCELLAGTPTLTEHSESRWVPVAELHSLDWAPADIPAVELLQERGA